MVKVSSITSLILGSIALVQCIPLEARDTPPIVSYFETCFVIGLDTGDIPFIDIAKYCLGELGIDCPSGNPSDTPVVSDEAFDSCIFNNEMKIEDITKRAQDCVEKLEIYTNYY
ncbi:unnamed protein product [Cunninghamella echinulata]